MFTNISLRYGQGRYYYFHLSNEKSKVQRIKVACPRSWSASSSFPSGVKVGLEAKNNDSLLTCYSLFAPLLPGLATKKLGCTDFTFVIFAKDG